MRVTIFFMLVLWAFDANCQERDSVFLYNGQVLIGEVQSIQLGVASIDDMDLKEVSVKLYKIKVLKTSKRFKIETQDKVLYYGTLQAGEKDGWVNILSDDGRVLPIGIEQLHQVIPLEKKFFESLNGSLSAGFSYTKSSGVGQINLSSNVVYAARKFEYQLTASANYSIDSSSFSRDREDISLLAAYNVTPTWFVTVNGSYQRNLELAIARRYQEMVGAGNKLFVKRNWQLLGITGISFSQELSTADVSSGLLLEIPVMLRYNFFQFQHPNIQISSQQSLYFGLTQKGRVRFEGNTSFSWELIRYFYLTINPYSNYDNQPPSGTSNYDYGVVLSISYKF